MRYAIIAAGEGSRLASEGVSAPKPLVEVNGEHLIDRLLRVFMDNNADEIVVICNQVMTDVARHLDVVKRDGLNGLRVPLTYVVKSTPSSMHSFFEISRYLTGGPFIMTTVDTIFREDEFHRYVEAFAQSENDGLMGVTDFIDDEKPLYVSATSSPVNSEERFAQSMALPQITGFYDTLEELNSDTQAEDVLISGGIYGLKPNAITTLQRCMERGESRMRNFQRALIRDGLRLNAYLFSKVLDIDHATDIQKAEDFLR